MTVIKYYTDFMGMVNPTYEAVEDPRKKGKIITKEEAKDFIKKLGLIVAHRDENGIIWDTPDKKFLTEFEGVGDEIKEI